MEFDAEPERIYAIVANPLLIPEWAGVFADRVEHVSGSTYRVTKAGEVFSLYLELNEAERVVEYLRELPDGKRGGARVTIASLASGGCEVSMRVPVAPRVTPEQVDGVLKQELEALGRLVGR